MLKFAIGGLLAIMASGSIQADEITIKSLPPAVIKTVPESGAETVDPKTTEIKVTFSKSMSLKEWSWSQLSEESFPEVNGKPKFLEDEKTCVLPVKLKPGTTYAIWINSDKFKNFRDSSGLPAVPYLLVFKTK